LLVAVSLLWSGAARAGNAKAAQQLFDAAIRLRKAGKIALACAKFRASMMEEPSVGALLNIAKCHEREGKLESAFADYERALELSEALADERRRKQIVEYVKARMRALEPRLPKADKQKVPKADKEVVPKVDEPSAKKPPPIRQSLPAPAPSKPTWPWAVGGAGLALGIVSAGFAIDYAVTFNALADACKNRFADCQVDDPSFDVQAHNERLNRDSIVSITTGASGAVALGIAIVGLVSASPPAATEPSQAVMVLPYRDQHGGGLTLQGRF